MAQTGKGARRFAPTDGLLKLLILRSGMPGLFQIEIIQGFDR